MKFGLMQDFRNPRPWFRPYGELYRLMMDQCVRAEGLGYDNIWLTEHHFSGDYNPTPLHAASRHRYAYGTHPYWHFRTVTALLPPCAFG